MKFDMVLYDTGDLSSVSFSVSELEVCFDRGIQHLYALVVHKGLSWASNMSRKGTKSYLHF